MSCQVSVAASKQSNEKQFEDGLPPLALCSHVFCPLDPSDSLHVLSQRVEALDPCLLLTTEKLDGMVCKLPLEFARVVYVE